jgi:hypothetical protein
MSAPAPLTENVPPLPLLLPAASTFPMSTADHPIGSPCADARPARQDTAMTTAEMKRRLVSIIV